MIENKFTLIASVFALATALIAFATALMSHFETREVGRELTTVGATVRSVDEEIEGIKPGESHLKILSAWADWVLRFRSESIL